MSSRRSASAAILVVLTCGPTMAAAQGKGAVCQRLADHANLATATRETLRRALTSPELLLGGGIEIPVFRTSDPALVVKAAKLFPGNPDLASINLQELAPGVWRASMQQGELACTSERFFRAMRGRPITPIANPPAFGDLCWTSGRRTGTVFGEPALIEFDKSETPLLGLDVEITPWTGAWRPSCRVALRFQVQFHIAESFCAETKTCAALADFASKLASISANTQGSGGASGDPRGDPRGGLSRAAPPKPNLVRAYEDRFAAAKAAFLSLEPDKDPLPTFETHTRAELDHFSAPPSMALVAVAGQVLLARVGVAGLEGRPLGDYLVALYRLDGPTPTPVASYVVEERPGALISAAASIPEPVLDAR